MPTNADTNMEGWLTLLKTQVETKNPELVSLLEAYAAEARFDRSKIDVNLKELPHNAKILEVGAGTLILSCQLVREGFSVTALEPFGEGFFHFHLLQKLVLEVAHKHHCTPNLVNTSAESFEPSELIDFAFSINVMEHVENVDEVIARVVSALKQGACYRFICPNYLFPYEPHFNIPTLFSKRATEVVFRGWIFSSPLVSDPVGTWASLNWISVPSVSRASNNLGNCNVIFKRNLLSIMIQRIADDPVFAARKPALIKMLLKIMIGLKLHKLTQMIPASLQPVMDCSIENLSRV